MAGFDALGRLALGQLPHALSNPVFEGNWHQSFSQPPLRRPPYAAARQQFATYVEPPPFAGVFTPALVPLWPGLSQPSWRKPPYHAARQQFASYVEAAPFNELVFVSEWFVPFSEPVRFSRRLLAANQRFEVSIEFPLSNQPVLEAVALTGVATLTGIPTSNYKAILTETKRRLIYAAEISPWTVAR